MPNDKHKARTKHAIDLQDSDSIGFVLAEDLPPDFVESTSRYEIHGELGRGGGGIVFKAKDTALNRFVAVKILRHELRDRPEIHNRFVQESKIICHLQHPDVAPIFDCGVCEDGRPFHSMKLVNGQTMLKLIEHGASEVNVTKAISAFAQVCQTIAYTHSHNIVHLDLKPGNFMIGEFGEVHVMDWGTARFLDENAQFESVGMMNRGKDRSRLVGGTLSYMSPEQAAGGVLDKRTDVFALGACLCHLLTGSPPYKAEDAQALYQLAVNANLTSAYKALRRCAADSALTRLAINCLQKDQNNRPRDAGAVANEMASYHAGALTRFQTDMTRFFELSHDLFCIAGLDGYFRRINSNFSRVLGFEQNELMSRPFMEFVHVDDHERTIAAMGQLVEGKPVIRFRNRYRTTTPGKFLEFEWTAKSIPAEDLIFAVARDVSES